MLDLEYAVTEPFLNYHLFHEGLNTKVKVLTSSLNHVIEYLLTPGNENKMNELIKKTDKSWQFPPNFSLPSPPVDESNLKNKTSSRRLDKEEDNNELELTQNMMEGENEKEVAIITEPEYYYIDIKGAVQKPAVYKLEKGSRIFDAIALAGGLKKDADTSVLNLSKIIKDEMMIIIYTKAEIKKFKEDNKTITEIIKEVEKENKCPDPKINQACNNTEEEEKPKEEELSTKVALNEATVEELQTLPGIGPSKAQDIINYRNEHGLFTTIEDIMNVKGIGESTFAQIKDLITL